MQELTITKGGSKRHPGGKLRQSATRQPGMVPCLAAATAGTGHWSLVTGNATASEKGKNQNVTLLVRNIFIQKCFEVQSAFKYLYAEAGNNEYLLLPAIVRYEQSKIMTLKITNISKTYPEPVLAGIDPHHLLDWEEKEGDDNIDAVIVEDGNLEK